MGLMAFLSASMLAIDVGMLMTARNQAQNSADAGALAGATALVLRQLQRSHAEGPAVTNAISAAHGQPGDGRERVGHAGRRRVPDRSDRRQPNRVKVTVYRTASRGNPVSTLIASYFGMSTADIGATADRRSLAGQRDDLRQAVHDSGSLDEKCRRAWDPNDLRVRRGRQQRRPRG